MAVREGALQIVVADNGKGFAVSQTLPGSDGLTGMGARLEQLGGRCAVTSRPGAGTTVEFHLPLGEGFT
jgi:two-component system sensor histidine kinase DegS